MIKCFDVVQMVTDEATEQFGSSLRENKENKKCLESYCAAIDSMAERFGGVCFEADVDDETMDISVGLICEEFEITDKDDVFYKLAERAKSLKFSIQEDENESDARYIGVCFTFGGIWERA